MSERMPLEDVTGAPVEWAKALAVLRAWNDHQRHGEAAVADLLAAPDHGVIDLRRLAEKRQLQIRDGRVLDGVLRALGVDVQ